MKTLLVATALIVPLAVDGDYQLTNIRHLRVFGVHAIDCRNTQTMVVSIKGDTADIRCK